MLLVYRCSECEENFQDKEELENHFLITHQGQRNSRQEPEKLEQDQASSNAQNTTGMKR